MDKKDNRWTNAKRRKPPLFKIVLVCDEYLGMLTAKRVDKDTYNHYPRGDAPWMENPQNVTHWMDLPTPPKGFVDDFGNFKEYI